MPVKLKLHTKQDVVFVAPVGSLDHAVAEEFQREVLATVDRGQARLALDLAQVRLVDSSGLGSIVALFKAARAAGGSVVLLNVSPDIQSIIRLTRLDKVLATCADEREVMTRFGVSPDTR